MLDLGFNEHGQLLDEDEEETNSSSVELVDIAV
jgi:hypothetical protein